MYQIPKQWEQPKHCMAVPSTAITRVICGAVIEYFCFSRQYFLWWTPVLSLWLHFMSVLIGHTLKPDKKYTTVLKCLSQSSWIWGRGTLKKQPLSLHEAKKPWLHPNGCSSSSEYGCVSTWTVFWGSCYPAAGRGSRQDNVAASDPEKPSDSLNSTQSLNGRT